MKGGVHRKSYFIFVLSNFLTFPLIGWFIGGIYAAATGFMLALIVDKLFPTWKSELTWNDIENALNNLYLYGNNPCELCFIIGNRKLYVYRDERGSEKEPIRLAVSIPLVDWSDLFTEDELTVVFRRYREFGIFCKNRGPESYVVYAKSGKRVDGCMTILRILFEKSVGGLKPDIYASSIVNSKKNIWVEHPS